MREGGPSRRGGIGSFGKGTAIPARADRPVLPARVTARSDLARRKRSSTQEVGEDRGRRLFKAELVGPGNDRPKQQLIVKNDDQQHRQHGVADGGKILLLDGQRYVGPDAGQRDRRIA